MMQTGIQTPRQVGTNPRSNPYTPPIPQPTANVDNLAACVLALKAGVESLIGHRGDASNRAVTFNDLVSFGFLSPSAVASPGGGATTGTVTSVTVGTGLTSTPNPITEKGIINLIVPVSVVNGGTGATTAGAALTSLGAAPLASPALTGNPTAPTPATADNDTSLATTAYVQAQGYATAASVSTADNLRVLKAGDTMTGTLNVVNPGGWSAVVLDSTAATNNQLLGKKAGKLRWELDLGNNAAESGSNSGADFTVIRYNDAEAYLGQALNINRATGDATFGGNIFCHGNAIVFAGATNPSAGPKVYANTVDMIFQTGSGNGYYYWWNVAGTELMHLDNAGSLVVHNGISSVGANAILSFSDRSSGNSWGLYSTGELARLWYGPSGDRFVVDSSGNATLTGTVLSFANGVRNPGSGGGPLIYGDGNWIVLKPGSGDLGTMFYNYGGVNVAQILSNGSYCSNNTKFVQCDAPNTGYNKLFQNDGVTISLYMGTGVTYYRNNLHYFDASDGTNRVIIDSNGLHVVNSILASSQMIFNVGGVNAIGIYSTTNIVPLNDNYTRCGNAGNSWLNVYSYAWTTSSDPSLKQDIEPVRSTLAAVLALDPKTYRWKDGPDTERRHTGFIATDVRDVLGEDFGGYYLDTETGLQGLGYNDLIAVLWKAVQELAAQHDALEARLK